MDPFIDLPEDLQTKKKDLSERKRNLEELIDKTNLEIRQMRKSCSHEAIPGTENHYATYCRKCGEMIDTWL